MIKILGHPKLNKNTDYYWIMWVSQKKVRKTGKSLNSSIEESDEIYTFAKHFFRIGYQPLHKVRY